MPDYSHFQPGFRKTIGLGVAAVKMESHKHMEDGGWHLSIDVRLGPNQESYMEAIKSGFNALMAALSPVPPIHEENYHGAEAEQEAASQSVEEYYQQARHKWVDPDNFNSCN